MQILGLTAVRIDVESLGVGPKNLHFIKYSS